MDRFVHWLARLQDRFHDRALMSVLSGIVTLFAVIACGLLVYHTGGIKFVYSHSMYLPIIFAAMVFGPVGGALTGALGALVLGPYMPLETATGEMQQTFAWLYRGLAFVSVGTMTGLGAALLRRQMRRIIWLAQHDPVTGVENQMKLQEEFLGVVARETGNAELSLIAVELLNYVEIIYTLGPAVARQLMPQIVERMRAAARWAAGPAQIQTERIAGVLVSEEMPDAAGNRLSRELRRPFDIDGMPVYVDVSIGISRFPAHGKTADELIQKALIATHWAGMQSQRFVKYETNNDSTSRDNLELLGLLVAAIENDELVLHYQPQIRLDDRRVIGVESLVRWQRPGFGLVAPGRFIPQAENTGLIHPMTEWCLKRLISQQRAWRATGMELKAAANLSVRTLQDPGLLPNLRAMVRDAALPPDCIEVEITEGALMADPLHASRVLHEMRELGFSVSVDDFGTGYSSLGYVKDLPLNALKIDQSFIRHMREDHRSQSIVRMALDLSRDLELESVAEGVEDLETLERLRELGCNYAQGYCIERPLAADALEHWMASHTREGVWMTGPTH